MNNFIALPQADVYVTDSTCSTALGNSLEATWQRLCQGESAIAEIDRFNTDRLDFHNGACIEMVKEREFSGKNRVCELMLPVLDHLGELPEETFVIWTGIKGNVEYVEPAALNKPGSRLYLAKQYREWVCSYLGIKKGGMEVNAACASSTVGLALAAQMISEGRRSSVLVCGSDIVSRFIFTGFSALRGLTQTICRPFDKNRDGLTLGDGAAALLLVNTEEAKKRNVTAKLTGWGISNDANHITGPAKDGRGLIKAIRSALDQANIAPSKVEAFCAHGTGTVYNDAMELTALEAIFGKRSFPLFSVKGAIGHTLGAAGAMEAILSIKSMLEQKIPPTTGLENPEERAKRRAKNEIQTFDGNNILTTNSGFGGCNAALLFEKV